MNNELNGLNGFGKFVFNRLRLNMCCCVLRRQDTSATDGCAEKQINQINPLWEKYIVRVRRNLTQIERIERILEIRVQ